MKTIKPGDCITITARKCSDKVQPNIQVGNIYGVQSIDCTRKGTMVLVVYRVPGKTFRVNADRFSWQYWDKAAEEERKRQQKKAAMEVMFQTAQAKAWAEERDHLLNDFTFNEQAKISYIPLMVYYIAWQYAEKTIKYAADHRIEEVKKLSRAVRMLREKYLDYLKQDLDHEHLQQVRRQADLFMQEHQLLFTQFYFTVLNSINHQHIGISYDELRAYAFIAKIFLLFLYNFENEMTELIRKRLGAAKAVHLPHQAALRECMEAYLGDFTIEMSNEVETGLRIFINEFNKIEYVVIKDKAV